MKNNSFQDVIPPSGSGRRSIRDIPIPANRQNKITELLEETVELRMEDHRRHFVNTEPSQALPPKPRKTKKSSNFENSPRRGIWTVAGISVAVLGVAFYFLFLQKADVKISLKTENIPVDVFATSTANTPTSAGALTYRVIPIQKESSVSVNTTGTPTQVDKKASGTIIIYNNYSSAKQQLIATTRFETPDGLIFHLDKLTIVPGTTVVAGKTVPGSIEATITADQSGDKYNIDKKDFTIPGFKGSSKFQAFYGRSKTAMSGGFSGMMGQVSDADLKSANDALKTSLLDAALQDVATNTPENYIFFKDGVRNTFSSSMGSASDGKAELKGKLILEALVFDQNAIENIIADSVGERYHFDNLDSLALSIQNLESSTSFISNPSLKLELKGTLTTGQSFDTSNLKKALSGKAKTQLQEILKLYPEIIKAEAVVHPFWSKSFPENVKNINVTVTK
ncbi:MAG: hypothetical protein WC629_01235 [Candidatus Paceibacterota bacterium]|jgi:hypothetical protein